ncbi:MAG TPA: four helix bundle protein [Myxococcaceae bacterium]|nr:four helix bundle protein [Myxococcaceae bacterium]
MQRFTDIKVWQQAHFLALAVYPLSGAFPKEEVYGLVAQLRRAAISTAANIAEGAKRVTRTEYARFLNIAEGSAAETEYLLRLARDLGFATKAQVDPLLSQAEQVQRMLFQLRTKVEATGALSRSAKRRAA